MPRICRPNATLSSTDFQGKIAYSWNTTLLSGLPGAPGRMVTLPPESGVSPARMRRNVDLPQPEGPTMQTNSPSATSRLQSPIATPVPRAVSNVLLTFRALILGGVATLPYSP